MQRKNGITNIDEYIWLRSGGESGERMFSLLVRMNTNFPIQHFIKIIIENKSKQVKSVYLFTFNKSNEDTESINSTFRIRD